MHIKVYSNKSNIFSCPWTKSLAAGAAGNHSVDTQMYPEFESRKNKALVDVGNWEAWQISPWFIPWQICCCLNLELGHYIICLQGRVFLFFFFFLKLNHYCIHSSRNIARSKQTQLNEGVDHHFLHEQGSTHLNCFASSNSKRSYLEFSRKYGAPQVCLFRSRDEKPNFSSQDVQDQPDEEAGITQLLLTQLQIIVAGSHLILSVISVPCGNNCRFQSLGTPRCLEGSPWEEGKLQTELLDIFLASVVLFQLGHSFWRFNFPSRDADLHQCNLLQSWQKLNFAAPAPWHGSPRVFFGVFEGAGSHSLSSAAPANTKSKGLSCETWMLRDFSQCVFLTPRSLRAVRF